MIRRPSARAATAMVLVAGAMAVSGCDTIGNPLDIIQGQRSAPDEFQVVARKPLRMPGTLDLPEPRLGEASPLEPDPQTDAVVALLGQPTTARGAAGGAGERALLDAANANAQTSEIRAALEEQEATYQANKPYEPPSIFELLSGDDNEPVEDALDPSIEARRLQTEGVAPAPINPEDAPADGEERSSGDGRYYSYDDARQPSPIPSGQPKPAF